MLHLILQTTLPSFPTIPPVPPSWTDFIIHATEFVVAIAGLIGVIFNHFTKASKEDVKVLAQASSQSDTPVTPALVAKVNEIAGTGDGSIK